MTSVQNRKNMTQEQNKHHRVKGGTARVVQQLMSSQRMWTGRVSLAALANLANIVYQSLTSQFFLTVKNKWAPSPVTPYRCPYLMPGFVCSTHCGGVRQFVMVSEICFSQLSNTVLFISFLQNSPAVFLYHFTHLFQKSNNLIFLEWTLSNK